MLILLNHVSMSNRCIETFIYHQITHKKKKFTNEMINVNFDMHARSFNFRYFTVKKCTTAESMTTLQFGYNKRVKLRKYN